MLFRHDAWYTVLNALRTASASSTTSVVAAVVAYRNRTRGGRHPMRRIVSRPTLSKGLEYDHAIILDGDNHTPASMYVALTRARKSLTVISASPIVRPMSPCTASRTRSSR